MNTMYQQQPMQQLPQGSMQQQLDPEFVRAVLALQQQQGQQSEINRNLRLADQMRADAGQQLQGRNAGRVYRAPNALNVAANVLGNVQATRMGNEATQREQAMGSEKADVMRRFLEALGRGPQSPGAY